MISDDPLDGALSHGSETPGVRRPVRVASDRRALDAESFSHVRVRAPRWLWQGRIPLGTASLLVGREKLGKSTLAVELAARVSRGQLPGDLQGEPAATLIVSYEDSAASTIKPRLLAAGADVGRVHRVFARRGEMHDLVSLPDDVEAIAGIARDRCARLLVVDPLSASLNREIDSYRDQDIRRALAPLVQLAEECDLAALCLAHWNKSPGGDSLSRVLGSRGLTAGVRSILAFGREPEAEDGSPDRVLAHAACNLAPEAPSLSCRIEGREIEGEDGEVIPTSRLVIAGESAAHADELLVVRSHDERTECDAAADWLCDELADGEWHEVQSVIAAARDAGISRPTLYRAREVVNLEAERRGWPARARWRLTVVSGSSETLDTTVLDTTVQTPVKTGDSARRGRQLSQVSEVETTEVANAGNEGRRSWPVDECEPSGARRASDPLPGVPHSLDAGHASDPSGADGWLGAADAEEEPYERVRRLREAE